MFIATMEVAGFAVPPRSMAGVIYNPYISELKPNPMPDLIILAESKHHGREYARVKRIPKDRCIFASSLEDIRGLSRQTPVIFTGPESQKAVELRYKVEEYGFRVNDDDY